MVFALAINPAVLVGPGVPVARRKPIRTLAVAEAMEPFALVLVAVCPLVDAVAVRFVLVPLANVRVAVLALPNAVAVLDPFAPLAVVRFAIAPLV
jgi:hypothetical protein